MATIIQHKRGTFANMPALADGEFYFASDKLQLFVGFGGLVLNVGNPMSAVSLSDATGKAAIMKSSQLTTAAVTANQVVLTYTVTTLKNLFLQYLDLQSRLTVPAATASVLGTVTVTIAGVVVYTADFVNPTTSATEEHSLFFAEPLPIAAGSVIQVLVTPAAATSMRWTANIGGFEK